MLAIEFIRDNTEVVKKAAADKGVKVDIDRLLELDGLRRQKIQATESLRTERNNLAGSTKGSKPTAEQIARGKELKDLISSAEDGLIEIEAEFGKLISQVPNIPSDDTPVGHHEDDNVILRQVGEKPVFDFIPQPHWEMKRFIDEDRAVRTSGSRFVFLRGGLVKLQLALIQFGFDVLTDEARLKEIAQAAGLDVSTKPFEPMLPPMMMRTEAYQATGRLKPEEVTFKLANDNLWLTGSSEHSMCAYHMGEVLNEADLPLRYVGYNTAFRREVGSAGKDTRGMIRQHQFDKLEMESFTTPAQSRAEHDFMIAIQEYLMQQLQIPYQLVLKCTFDMGAPNVRGVDVEAWMAGQNTYRETHTADMIGDYQARGLNTKYRDGDGQKHLVHTNDATAFSQRPLIAMLENNQQADGMVRVPKVLQPYMGGIELL